MCMQDLEKCKLTESKILIRNKYRLYFSNKEEVIIIFKVKTHTELMLLLN